MAFSKLAYLRLARHGNLTHAQHRVLVAIVLYAKPDGTNSHPGYVRLVKECRMSRTTVHKCIAHLKKAGWLWESSRGRPSEERGDATVFDLRIPPYLIKEVCPGSTTQGETINKPDGSSQPSGIGVKEDPWG